MTMNTSPSNSITDELDFLSPVEIPDDWKSRTGKGVSVAIIDSGIDTAHPALLGQVFESVE
jgi:subtilisin family serine protease